MKTEEQIQRRKDISRRSYIKHKEAVKIRGMVRMEPRLKWLKEIKETTPCSDCGRCFPSECMDYDHLPGKKKFHPVAHLLHYADLGVAKAEIEKCQLVCACCHRTRTALRRAARGT